MGTRDHHQFVDYYAAESLSPQTLTRYRSIQNVILSHIDLVRAARGLDVADVGCGAGTQCLLWAELGHRAHGLDINTGLIELGKQRAAQRGLNVSFYLGTATQMPWADASMDACIMPELIEHVADWQQCLNEASRVLRHGGVLYLSTPNKLSPRQDEFNLPLYSWYPAFVKRWCVKKALSSHPQLANYATYPAVNWFTYYGLRSALRERGFDCFDRFDTVNTEGNKAKAAGVSFIRAVPPVRLGAHALSKSCQVLAVRR
jgi:2-polyprenyl-6-hydroxyphenyl methylase/3-demethylubiquinone-9 3-methyltransferase